MYAVVGASGSGKTTLLSLLAGLDVPTGGDVFWDGRSTSKLDRDAYRREHVSVIYQNFNLFAHLTVLENVAYPLYMRKMPRGEANDVARDKLFSVGIKEEQFSRMPNMLSGGEQQRAAIARALSSGSEVVLADEPTGNLDGGNGRNVVDILKRLSYEEGRCVIVVTHDALVAGAADVTLQIRDGKVIL
jgi:putative ABC transport system ATP-binding protein